MDWSERIKTAKKARVTDNPEEIFRYQQLRRETKKLTVQKKKALKLGDMVVSNSKRFWTVMKSATKERASPNV